MIKKWKKLKDLIKLIEDFNLFIKQCDHIAWSVEKIQKEMNENEWNG